MIDEHAGFLPDLSRISFDSYKKELRTGRLLPSRLPLLDGLDERFAALEKAGLNDLAALRAALAKSRSLMDIAARTGIDEAYLKLLRREVNSILPTPVAFKDVPNMPDEILVRLADMGIADTQALFPFIRDPTRRRAFAAESDLSDNDVLWLAKLVDISRIKWTGPKLARLIVDTEFDTVAKLAHADPASALSALKRAKAQNKAYEGPLGIDDIDSWIRQIVSKMPEVISF